MWKREQSPCIALRFGWSLKIGYSLLSAYFHTFMPLLIIDFRIHWRYISTCKSSTCTVELQELCRPCRTKWIWEILGNMNQLTLPRLGGWVWLKIERMTLLFKVLKLPDTSCVVIQLLIMIVNRIMLIYKINYDPWDKEIHYWNLHRITPLYIIDLSVLLHFHLSSHST